MESFLTAAKYIVTGSLAIGAYATYMAVDGENRRQYHRDVEKIRSEIKGIRYGPINEQKEGSWRNAIVWYPSPSGDPQNYIVAHFQDNICHVYTDPKTLEMNIGLNPAEKKSKISITPKKMTQEDIAKTCEFDTFKSPYQLRETYEYYLPHSYASPYEDNPRRILPTPFYKGRESCLNCSITYWHIIGLERLARGESDQYIPVPDYSPTEQYPSVQPFASSVQSEKGEHL